MSRNSQGSWPFAIVDWRTILEYGGPIKLDHDLIGIFILLHVTHFAQVLGLHQRNVLRDRSVVGDSTEEGHSNRGERCRQLLHSRNLHPQ